MENLPKSHFAFDGEAEYGDPDYEQDKATADYKAQARQLAAQLLILANDFHESKDLEELAYNIGGHIESADAALTAARKAGLLEQ